MPLSNDFGLLPVIVLTGPINDCLISTSTPLVLCLVLQVFVV